MENSIEALIGSSFIKKKSHNERDKESQFNTEECGLEEVTNASFLGLLFSAHWCPPCDTFLKILKDFYSEVNIDRKKVEILYVSVDKTEDQFRHHYAEMPWLSLPFLDPRVQSLKQKYDIKGIPILVIVDSITGLLVTVRGRKDIHEQSVQSVNDWTKLLELNRERVIKQAEEEMQLEIQRQKLQQQHVLADPTQQQQPPVIGANLT